MTDWQVVEGDCVERMAQVPDASVDAVVCDPPYGLEFMGKEWDRLGAGVETATEDTDASHPFRDGSRRVRYGASARSMQAWHEAWAREALRVLKPGGHLLAFGGSRTSHRLACAIEDAGFEIRDSIIWMYGSGFPKSLDVSKAIDKAAGAERAIVGASQSNGRAMQPGKSTFVGHPDPRYGDSPPLTAPATPEAEQWHGWGTALKPAHEPIVVARKALAGTVAGNVLAHGTGALNIEECRIGTEPITSSKGLGNNPRLNDDGWKGIGQKPAPTVSSGRWPANVVLSHAEDCVTVGTQVIAGDQRQTGNGKRVGGFVGTGADAGDPEPNAAVYGDQEVERWACVPGCPVRALDAQTGERRSAGLYDKGSRVVGAKDGAASIPLDGLTSVSYDDAGGASRFFYCAKTSRAERNAGLESFEPGPLRWSKGDENPGSFQGDGTDRSGRNNHPTVKPIDLMRWLVRLVTPPDGLVLDPFIGSGTTGIAAILEGFRFIGIEREPEYIAIAKARIAFFDEHGEDALRVVAREKTAEQAREQARSSGQDQLF